jgi:hypothetical protein
VTRVLPHPIHQATYFSLVSPMSLGSVSRPRVVGGDGPGGEWAGPGGGGGGGVGQERREYPVARGEKNKIYKFSY